MAKKIVQLVDDEDKLFPIPSSKTPDLDNIIAQGGASGGTSTTYNVVQECYLLASSSGGAWAVVVDGVSLGGTTDFVSLHNGQVVVIYQYYEYGYASYTIYGVKYS